MLILPIQKTKVINLNVNKTRKEITLTARTYREISTYNKTKCC